LEPLLILMLSSLMIEAQETFNQPYLL